MNLLLDTCTLLWSAFEVKKLSKQSTHLIEDPDNVLFLSAVSVWEIEVKYRSGKIKLNDRSPKEFIAEARKKLDLYDLSFDVNAALLHEHLPPIHRDPFDRMLICQANEHNLTLLTPDDEVKQYDVKTEW